MQCMVSTNIQLSFGTSPSGPVLIALILRQRPEMLSVCCGLRTSAFDHASSLSLGTGCLSEHPQCGAYNDGTDEEPSHLSLTVTGWEDRWPAPCLVFRLPLTSRKLDLRSVLSQRCSRDQGANVPVAIRTPVRKSRGLSFLSSWHDHCKNRWAI